jgi:hypothetical protein
MKNRKAFNFYRSYYDVAVELPDDQKLQFLMAILNKQFLDVEPKIDGLVGLLYKSQKHSIDKQVDGYKHKKGISTVKAPTEDPCQHPTEDPCQHPTEDPCLDPSVQVEEKGEEKEKEQVEEQVYVKNIEKQEWNNLLDKYKSFGWNSLKPAEAARYYELEKQFK